QKNDNLSYLPQNAESTEVQHQLDKFVKTQSTAGIVIYTRAGGLTDADKQKIAEDGRDFAGHLGDQLAAPPTGPPFSQKDNEAAEVILSFKVTDPNALVDTVQYLRDRAQNTKGLEAHVAGPAGLFADFGASFKGIDGILLVVTGIIVLSILILVYRSPILPFVVLGTAAFALT